jgi:hypothetical protein
LLQVWHCGLEHYYSGSDRLLTNFGANAGVGFLGANSLGGCFTGTGFVSVLFWRAACFLGFVLAGFGAGAGEAPKHFFRVMDPPALEISVRTITCIFIYRSASCNYNKFISLGAKWALPNKLYTKKRQAQAHKPNCNKGYGVCHNRYDKSLPNRNFVFAAAKRIRQSFVLFNRLFVLWLFCLLKIIH